jgi:hypothetical protein
MRVKLLAMSPEAPIAFGKPKRAAQSSAFEKADEFELPQAAERRSRFDHCA